MRHLSSALILLLVSASLAGAQDRPVSVPPDSARGQAAAQFQQEHGPAWRVAWHEKAGTPATLMGGRARGYSGPPEQAGRAFLDDHKKLFGIENARQNLDVAETIQSEKGSSRVQYRQVYHGIPVLNSGYLVAFDREGAVHYVSGDYYPDLQVDTSPKLQPGDAIGTMRSDLGGGSSFELRQEPVLSIFVDDSGEELTAHLAYEARAERRDPLEAYKYVVDAHSGEILQKISLIETIDPSARDRSERPERARTNEVPTLGASTTGSGDAYRTNPLHGSPTSVTLHRLDDVSPKVLEGDNVAVTNEEASEATSSTGDFSYSPSNTHFDEVMTYYHSDEFEAWLIGDLGMGTTRLDCEVSIETHSSDAYAATDPSNCQTWYSDGDDSFLRNPTRERSILDHEYMHDVSETYNSLDQDFDADALDEGYSDFFAVADRHANTSVTSRRLGAYVGFGSGRTVDNSYQLDDFYSSDPDTRDLTDDGNYSEHDGGVVLAGALWDFKQAINDVTLAAEITLESLKHLDSDPSFYDARSAMLTAADGTGNSQYKCDIRRAFEEHGIGGSGLLVSISGPNELDGGEEGTWTTSVACPGSSISYQWYEKYASDDSFTAISGATSSSYTASYYGDVDLKVEITSDGYAASDVHSVTVNCDRACTASIEEARALSGSSEDRPGGARTTRGQTERPDAFALRGSTPNPVRTQATIRYAMPGAADVTLTVYDVTGRHVATLTEGRRSVGVHEVTLEATGLPSGVYLYRLQAGSYRETKRLVVVK